MKYKLSRYLLQKVSDTFGNLVSLKRFGTVPDCTASGSCRSRGCLKAMNERKKIAKKNLKVIEQFCRVSSTTTWGAEHDAAAGEQAAAGNAANEQAAEAWEAVASVFG